MGAAWWSATACRSPKARSETPTRPTESQPSSDAATPCHHRTCTPPRQESDSVQRTRSTLSQELQQRPTALGSVARSATGDKVFAALTARRARDHMVTRQRVPCKFDVAVRTMWTDPPHVVLIFRDEDSIDSTIDHVFDGDSLVLRDSSESSEAAAAFLHTDPATPQVALQIELRVSIRATRQGVVFVLPGHDAPSNRSHDGPLGQGWSLDLGSDHAPQRSRRMNSMMENSTQALRCNVSRSDSSFGWVSIEHPHARSKPRG